ncbi:MAG: TetR/AcrR family transcriptional regulator C-terminal domain-containing protein [Lachnospiraceae bacterium]|nr:TetR/AcrR family transcriptional regulator C-terminal domain-containing protein [Lachnospiraceae bacterium]
MPRFTKRAIKAAFVRLLEKKPFDKITVKDIAQECGINRNSFYYHYEDISALIKDILKGLADAVFDENSRIASMPEAERTVVAFVMKKKRAAYHLYNSSGREIYEKQLMDVCRSAAGRVVDDACVGRNISARDRDIMIRAYKDFIYGAVIDWMESGMNYDIISEFERFSKLTEGRVASMLDRAEALGSERDKSGSEG